jgi:hypothetical protein
MGIAPGPHAFKLDIAEIDAVAGVSLRYERVPRSICS